jgi:hypothetical protein
VRPHCGEREREGEEERKGSFVCAELQSVAERRRAEGSCGRRQGAYRVQYVAIASGGGSSFTSHRFMFHRAELVAGSEQEEEEKPIRWRTQGQSEPPMAGTQYNATRRGSRACAMHACMMRFVMLTMRGSAGAGGGRHRGGGDGAAWSPAWSSPCPVSRRSLVKALSNL